MKRVTDLHVANNVPLTAPNKLCQDIPRTAGQAAFVAKSREAIHDIIFDDDDRFLCIVGPCSIHDVDSGREYAERLAELAKKIEDRIMIVMRVYFEKPRTTVGWKGLIMDPQLDGTADIETGLRTARTFLGTVLDLGLPTATELLDPITPQYIADLISWSAIGARTSESQTHRQMASGLSMPLGFKNATPGTLLPAVNGISAATQPQTFLGISEEGVASAVSTNGNPDCHLILRGGTAGPNYEAKHVAEAEALLSKHGLCPSVMVDASHANCDKDHAKMPAVFENIVDQFAAGNRNLIGAMIESNLKAGKQSFPQPLADLEYGLSITDPCIDFETTEKILLAAHANVAR